MSTTRRPRVLLISADLLGSELAGVSIRAYELAKVLREHADVTLAGVRADSPPPADLRTITYVLRDPRELRPEIARADVVLAQPQWPLVARWLRDSRARLIYDLLTPEPLELMESTRGRWLARRLVIPLTIDRILEALYTGDHFVCAGQKQRDLWLGAMLGQRLITPSEYDQDPSLRSVIDTVAFGAPAEPPRHGGHGIRARFPVLRTDDEIAVWSGGIWNWLDADTAIRAAAILSRRRPRFRLVFMAASPSGAAREATERAHALARELGLHGSVVLFNDSWVPYDQRADWLLEADCALSTHVEHLETRFAFRTRVLDAFWTGLPVVCTRGDELADRIEDERLGATAAPSDPEDVAAALERVLEEGRRAFAGRISRTAADFTWARVAEPLVRYVTDPSPPRHPRRRQARRAAHVARDFGFCAALGGLNTLGVKKVPFV